MSLLGLKDTLDGLARTPLALVWYGHVLKIIYFNRLPLKFR